MPKVKLTARNVLTLAPGPGEARAVYRDSVLSGLELRVSPTGARVYRVRYGAAGDRAVTLSDARVQALSDARDLAREILGRVARGEDPASERAQARAVKAASADTLEALARRLVLEAELADTTRRSWLWILERHVSPALGKVAPGAVTRGDVRELLAGVPSATVRNDVLKVLRWTYARAIEADLVEHSPCLGLRKPTRERPRDRVLASAELRSVWQACAEAGVYGQAVRFALLTAARREEVFGLQRSELDLESGVWRIPAARAKNRRAHDVPLSQAALEALAEADRLTGGVEARPFPLRPASKPWRALLVAAGVLGADDLAEPARSGRRAWAALPMRFHDLRRTARETLTRDLGVSVPVAEAVLGHAAPRLVQTYAPGGVPLRDVRHALERWAGELARIVEDRKAERVTAMPRRD